MNDLRRNIGPSHIGVKQHEENMRETYFCLDIGNTTDESLAFDDSQSIQSLRTGTVLLQKHRNCD